jgi:hypothetical protein
VFVGFRLCAFLWIDSRPGNAATQLASRAPLEPLPYEAPQRHIRYHLLADVLLAWVVRITAHDYRRP